LTTPTRIALTALFGLLLAFWTGEVTRGGLFTGSDLAGVALYAIAFLAGAVVGRWWVILALIGPYVTLAVLEITDSPGWPGDWRDEPLLSPPGIAIPLEIGMVMLLGVLFGTFCLWLSARLRRGRG
jgi:hypothetical protein